MASKPLNFQTSRKPEDQRKPTNRCRRCGKFSSGELCETHLRLETTRQDDNNNEPSTSHTTMPTMPAIKKRPYNRVVIYDSSSHGSESTSQYADNGTSEEEEITEDATLKEAIDREVVRLRSQTPMLTSPIGCSTEIPQTTDATPPDEFGTPIRGQNMHNAEATDQDHTGKTRLKQNIRDENNSLNSNLEPRRSERIRAAKRVVKLGGVEYL